MGAIAAMRPLEIVEAQPGLQIRVEVRGGGVEAVAEGDAVVLMQAGAWKGCVRSQTTRRSEATYALIDSLELVAISVINPCQRARNSRRWSGSGT